MKKHLTTLFLIRKNGSTGTFVSNDSAAALAIGDQSKGIKRLETLVLQGSEKENWQIAYLYDAQQPQGAAPLHCYHYTKGIARLDKQEAEELRFFNTQEKDSKYRAYIIPTAEAQRKGKRPSTKGIETLEDAKFFLKKDTWKIQIYEIATNALVKTII